MNKRTYLLALLVSFLFIGFTSCSDDDDTTDYAWRSENEDFFKSLSTRTDLHTINAGSGSGYLYYKVLKSGTNLPSPIYTSIVNVYYTGATLSGFDVKADTIIAGKEFDTSYSSANFIGYDENNQGIYKPVSFTLSNLIEGWWVALQEMKPGDKWQLYIPWQLGYKSSGSGTSIPGYSTLIFEVELESIKKY